MTQAGKKMEERPEAQDEKQKWAGQEGHAFSVFLSSLRDDLHLTMHARDHQPAG